MQLAREAIASPCSVRLPLLPQAAAEYAAGVHQPPDPLTTSEHRCLVEIIRREAPDLVPLAQDAVNARWLEDNECQALSQVLLRVFINHLGSHDEPDRQGVEADGLIGRVEMQRRGYWRS